jgi:hypothetical protein
MQARAAERAAKAGTIEQRAPAANGCAASVAAEKTSNDIGKPGKYNFILAALYLAFVYKHGRRHISSLLEQSCHPFMACLIVSDL